MSIVESWYLENTQNYPQAIQDIATSIVLSPKGNNGYIVNNAISVGNNTSEVLGASDTIRNLSRQGLIISDYTHSHNEFSLSSHTHVGLNILTGGSSSDASSLHTHSNLITVVEFDTRVTSKVEEVVLDMNLDSVYVRKDGSINQLNDITSSGEVIEESVLKAHNKDHTFLEHIDGADPFTIANFIKLFDGSNADCLHVHSGGTSGFEGEHNDLDGLQGGTVDQYYHITSLDYSNLGTLTDGSNADSLHTHTGLVLNHNSLSGLQGIGTDYFHLSEDQYFTLVGGSSVNADDYHTHSFVSSADEIPLGNSCHGNWEDGLFSWDNSTITACALDDINDLLASLAPPPAPSLRDIGSSIAGVEGKLSFDETYDIAEAHYEGVGSDTGLSPVLVDNVFAVSGDRIGIIDNNIDMYGVLNADVAAHAYSYSAYAFGNADQGVLIIELNGEEVVSQNIDLTDLSSQDTTSSGTTTGIIVSSATSCEFNNGDSFDLFKYRTGSWRVIFEDMRLGWNYVRMIHRIGTEDSVSNYIDWVVDGNSVTTDYSNIVFDTLVMTNHGNSSDYLSGVQYWRHGTARYGVTVKHGQRNTYKTGNAITFSLATNGTVSSQSFLNTNGNETQDTDFPNLTFTINTGIRLLNGSITCRTSVDRVLNSLESNSSISTISGILMDDLIDHTLTFDSSENFNGEGYRLPSNLSLTSVSYTSGSQHGPVVWDSTKSIANSGDAGYNNGLLIYSGTLRYPTQGILSGDFRDNSDGGTLIYAPITPDNPNYSSGSATGEREYLRYFYNSTSRQNFRFVFTVVAPTTFVAAINRGSLSGNNVTCEILAPNTTTNGISVEFKDMVTSYSGSDNAIGAYASTYGGTIPTYWGVTIGTKSTANSGNVIVIRVTASASWTGSIEDITCTFL